MADFGASGSSAMDPTKIVPVLLSIKFFDGDEKDDIYYHYFFSPPPLWVMSQHGWQAFAVVETPLLLEDEQWKREYFLDRDIKDILSLTKESLMEYYGSDAENLGLGPRDKWVTFVTEYDGVELISGTTLRKLIDKFLESKPITGSPLIISLINAFDQVYGLRQPIIVDLPVPLDQPLMPTQRGKTKERERIGRRKDYKG